MSIPLGSTRGAGRATGGMIEMMFKLCFYMLKLCGYLIAIPFILMYLAVKSGYGPVTRFYQNPDVEVRRKRRLNSAFVLTTLLGLATLLSLFRIDVMGALTCGAVTAGCAYWAWREYQTPIIAENARIAALAAQNDAHLNGTYGPPPTAPEPYQFVDTRQP
ncbi:hypothetical protein B2J88_01795 [Rhodococcus sp. SRB_17]|nr:hypothetical protein [Rhodococcus sp. SRB_17]